MSEGGRTCLGRCCSVIFTLGLTSLFLWLSLRAEKPKYSINSFYLPALNRTLNQSNENTTLYFEVKLKNPNKDKGIYYDDVKVNVTVFDSVKNGSYFIGNTTITHFYQGHKKTAKKPGQIPYNKTVIARGVFPNGTAVFQVDMATAVRFKILSWKTKRHRVAAGVKVEMNENGTKVNPAKKTDVPLILVMLNFLVLILLSFW